MGKIRRPSGTWPMPSATTSWLGTRWIGFPSKKTVPDTGRTSPEIVRRVVDLPAPLAPSRATISPWSTARLTSRSARMGP